MITITIKTDNAAFEDDKGIEVARILRRAAERVENGVFDFYLMDINGNKVGKLTDDEE